MASAAPEPVHSSEQNIQIPALTAPHANQQKKPKDKKAKAGATSEHPLELQPPPEFFDHRIKIFEKLKAEYDEWVKVQPKQEIEITLPDKSVRKGTS